MEMRKHIPILICELDGCSGNYSDIRFSLRNVSDNVANNLSITDCKVFNEQGETILKSNGINNDTGRIPNTICAGERVSLRFNNAEPNGSNLTLIFNVQCEDKFGNQILYKATKYIKDSKKFDGKIEFFEV